MIALDDSRWKRDAPSMRRGLVLSALILVFASAGCDSGTAVEPGPRGAPVVLAVEVLVDVGRAEEPLVVEGSEVVV